jgi:phosphoenolpyruvate-protein phosphotransferase
MRNNSEENTFDALNINRSQISGISIHSGIEIGKVYKKTFLLPDIPNQTSDFTASEELERLEFAIEQASEDIQMLINSTTQSDGIFEAHVMILNDPELKKQAKSLIAHKNLTAESAFIQIVNLYKNLWQNAGQNGFMAEKSSDITDVAIRVLRHLGVRIDTSINPTEEVILVVNDLSPSEAIKIDTRLIRGVICASGNQTSHSAILVKSLGIPAIFGARGIMEAVLDHQEIILDGSNGIVFTNFDNAFKVQLEALRNQELENAATLAQNAKKKCVTTDGIPVRVQANISLPEHISIADKFGIDGVGLFRTEFIYFNRDAPPSEDEQFEIYQKVVLALKGRPVTFRTADFGGDKPISYLGIPTEENPFLGLRGIRYSLRNIELFKTQLRAIYRASCHGPVSIMFPMIATKTELDEAIRISREVEAEFITEGHPVSSVQLGLMIEVPAAVVQIDTLLKSSDFVSIGTNDLAQYVMATDRLNPVVGDLASGCQPALLSMIEQVIKSANKAGKSVSICGEMAGDIMYTEVLFGFGLRDFSMSHDLIPQIKGRLSELNEDDSRKIAGEVVTMESSHQVQELLKAR